MGIHVSNLSRRVTEKRLKHIFSEYGNVRSITISKNRKANRSGCFASVELTSESEEEAAVRALNGTALMGQKLQVTMASSSKISGNPNSQENLSSGISPQLSSELSTTLSNQSDNIQEDFEYFNKYISKSSHTGGNCQIVLDGNLEEISRSDLQILIHQLRTLSKDPSIIVVDIKSGSIVLRLEGSEEGFKVLRELWRTGQIKSLIGLPIEAIHLELNSIDKQNVLHTEAINDAEATSNVPIESSVTHINVFNQSTVQQNTQTSLLHGSYKTDMTENYTNNFQSSNIANMANTVKDHGRQQANQNISAPEISTLITESVKEVEAILQRLERHNSITSQPEKIKYLDKTIQPKFKERLVKALTDGGESAIEELFDNSYIAIIMAAVKGWMNP